jgi:FkbM family methyltransferase
MKFSMRRILDSYKNPWRRVFYASLKRWRKEKGNEKRFRTGTITPENTVFDFGGYEGAWTERILTDYRCKAHVFEPHPTFAARLERKFAAAPNVVVHAYALASQSGSLTLSDDGDASSALTERGTSVGARMVSVEEFFAEFPMSQVRLAKINIEGGEYDLIPALVAQGVIDRFACLQIQFHLFAPEDIARRQAVRALLAQTHRCDWAYDFVWEQWSLK